MAKPDSLGQFEQLVRTAILTLREDVYGVTIHSKVQELARPKPVSLGAVYVTLDRLEDKGLVASWMSHPTPERGGAAPNAAIGWRPLASVQNAETAGAKRGLMYSGRSKTAEAIVAVFIPHAYRSEVLGDLHEWYSSLVRYGFDALRTIPVVILSRVRRIGDPQVLLMQAVAL